MNNVRHLIWILGDQLDLEGPCLDGFDPERDVICMAEVGHESTKVWTHKARIVLFLSAMRHFREALISRGCPVDYTELDPQRCACTLGDVLGEKIKHYRPERCIITQPGEYSVLQEITRIARQAQVPLTVLEDRHFLCTTTAFRAHAAERKQLRMEFFYRMMRKKTGILMDGSKPVGGRWNFDAENRGSFGKSGPPQLPQPPRFKPDPITRQVIELVERRFPNHPGSLESFQWPVERAQALTLLHDFIEHRLPRFGEVQDAMHTNEPFLYHALISTSLNLKMLSPLEVIQAAEQAYHDDPVRYPLNAVEGFIRQILGWREYVRGVYWLHMPDYLEQNSLGASADLPDFYWTGDTDMNCLHQVIGQTLRYGYAHHIQRLMVTGLFSLLLGVHPQNVHAWYLAIYVDAVEWVELPNTLGMSQYADGGIMASKPYVATGKYIDRMSNYCQGCRYKPSEATGPEACPFTTLYWDFLQRHEQRLRANPRMTMQLKNLDRLPPGRIQAIQQQADTLRRSWAR